MPTARPLLSPRPARRRIVRPPAVLLLALLLSGLAGRPALAQDAPPADPGQASVPMFQGNPARTGVQPGPAPEGNPVVKWEFATGAAVRSSPAVVDGVVFVGSKDGHVYAIDAASGAERWRFATGGPVVASPAVHAGSVLVGSEDGFFYALDAGTGERRWSYRTWATGSPTVADGVVYVSSNTYGRTLHAIEVETGLERWHATFSFQVTEPAVAGQSVYVGADGFVQAFDKNTGLLRWIYQAPGNVWSSPVVGNGRVYAVVSEGDLGQSDVEADATENEDAPPDADENQDAGGAGAFAKPAQILALDAESGENRWTFSFPAERAPTSAMALADGTLLAGTPRGWLYALDVNTGRQRWGFQTDGFVDASPAVASGQVIFGTFNGVIHALDVETGEVKWHYQVTAPVLSSAAIVGGVVYVGSDAGALIAIGGSGAPAA